MTAIGIRKQKLHYLAFATLISLVILFVLTSCGPQYIYNAQPYTANKYTDYFRMEISPICEYSGCIGFKLEVKNLTNKDLELDWNKTLYVQNGNTSGGFIFEGIMYKDRKQSQAAGHYICRKYIY